MIKIEAGEVEAQKIKYKKERLIIAMRDGSRRTYDTRQAIKILEKLGESGKQTAFRLTTTDGVTLTGKTHAKIFGQLAMDHAMGRLADSGKPAVQIKTRKQIEREWLMTAGAFLLLLIVVAIGEKPSSYSSPSYTAPATSPAITLVREEELDPAIAKKEFLETRPNVMKMLKELMGKGYYQAAVSWGERYASVDDKEFQQLYKEAIEKAGKKQAQADAQRLDNQTKKAAFADAYQKKGDAAFIFMCRQLVTKNLRAPSSADFVEGSEKIIVNEFGKIITAAGQVDSQNTFGAMLRSLYACEFQYGGGDDWGVKDVRIETP